MNKDCSGRRALPLLNVHWTLKCGVMLPGPEIGAKKVVRFFGSSGCGEGWGNRKCFPSVVASVKYCH